MRTNRRSILLCTTFHAQTRVTVGGAGLRQVSSAGFTRPLARIPSMPTPPPAALLAFLRGLERRARTLAEVQCGNADRAATIWSETAAAFPAEATTLPVAAWPVKFWARLLAHPAMAVVDATESPLAALGPGPRAALLLRLVAGLDPRPAADVLGVSEPTYRFALQRGLEQARAAGIDADALQALRAQWQRQPPPSAPRPQGFEAAPLPAERVTTPAPVVEAPPVRAAVRTTRRFRLAWIGLAALAAAAVLSVAWWVRKPAPEAPARPVVLTAEAPVAPAPLAPVTHPDYALLAGGDDERLAQDLELLSWLAAGGDTAPAPAPPASTPEAVP
jgi:DNA-directed RNA polymerase specialized sigma24 family protein